VTYIVDATVRTSGDLSVRHIGKYQTADEAIHAAQGVVDGILKEHHRHEMAPRELFARYEANGVFPYIFLDHDVNTFNVRRFNHYQYALQRCAELCQTAARSSADRDQGAGI